MDLFDSRSILPPEPDGLQVLHDREYRVRAYRKRDDVLLIRGAVRDQKPAGLYIEGDPDPLTIHHMQVDLDVAFPSLEIVDVTVGFEMHPHETCPSITDHYDRLVGLSIARGFINKVRELFGGPRGCTHTTALLQAMAPVAIQSIWSLRAASDDPDGPAARQLAGTDDPARMNLNTCHVWAEDGDLVARVRESGFREVPIFLRRRLDHLGRDAASWIERARS